MKIKTQSCVVAGKQTVDVTDQEIEWNNKGTLVQITRGGICGSDLHYYQEGKVGNFSVKAPMVLGHEVIGKVVHSDSEKLHEGQTVAVNPSKPCGHCKYCLAKEENQCTEMRFFGSAMYFPHVDGGFTRFKVVDTAQCIPFSGNADAKTMAFAEPLAVAIHAAHQAGDLQGKRVFISGVGPIGCLIVSAVKTLGAAEIVCADISSRSLELAQKMGADTLLDPRSADLTPWKAEKGYFDVSFEVSGNPTSITTCLEVTRARGAMVQVGMGGAVADFPMMMLIAKEISLKGSFRFTTEFNTAVSWLANGVVDPLPLLSGEYPFTELEQALKFAGDKTQAAKVQLVF
ncbi:TPA: L-idonate 5-dehydrogenase [Kluyvera intermedia]|uniref:L-idonate 5-dehydrogenase n=2 Tax=Enterobacteriaceae TaxID=543 RepID=A0AAC8QTI7_9ENTR|nr:L-idonate 5-dehydrogenase [Phytobacter ursingii]HAT2206433.1 L-idonate 5-dehydrogenase [Kluyvera intermedia]AKL14685.1 L-idonate 5-dehydrogenase [Phytobacter ursingii]HAT2517107.1 L-idonate 5-dehydrogenase [Kluyvera intermedia]HAT2604932.1 L-idonate 5-dehydrogenase [Kluyvera intermedia]HAT2681832.1 L-idonate 5-dehydrogenase [Kluyvera intermedia]